ncbi:MAG: acyl carrier protein [Anaerolineales bacterium]|jgi:acyl carrier protein
MKSDHESINEQVKATLAEALQIEPEIVTPDLTFGDIPQWDSMGHMEVMMRLEEYFGVEINPDTISSLISLPLICEYINNTDR